MDPRSSAPSENGRVWCVFWRYSEDESRHPWHLGSIHRTEESAQRTAGAEPFYKVEAWGFFR